MTINSHFETRTGFKWPNPDTLQVRPCRLGSGRPWPLTVRVRPFKASAHIACEDQNHHA